jgi:hypothetical protein
MHNREDVKISVKLVLITRNRATASEAEWSLVNPIENRL